jgi:hypothetical protein
VGRGTHHIFVRMRVSSPRCSEAESYHNEDVSDVKWTREGGGEYCV